MEASVTADAELIAPFRRLDNSVTSSFIGARIGQLEQCALLFDAVHATWGYPKTTCGFIVSIYLNLVQVQIICVSILLINAITFCCIVRHKKLLRQVSDTRPEQRSSLLKNIQYYIQVYDVILGM
ncbi:hypothetical protein OESDEN_04729 [Oesophagostomum dentatum]|uniref:7TM GPCR serpentine receptor class x (Srx) domain-containing protein n=1 Tax=Oesophagostomum dentatum TaxID=61180 RepID=A0A0B1THM9_OESDE|nr:hypothetical protein OESDEN_04729 [Oesophagostomum dentatum]